MAEGILPFILMLISTPKDWLLARFFQDFYH